MKNKAVVCMFLVSLGLSILGAPTVVAAQYLGETTWTLTITDDEHGPVGQPVDVPMKGSITHLGGAYYTVQTFVDQVPDGNPIDAGGGILVGDLLYLTLAHSQKHLSTDRETGVTHIELEKATLNGTFYQVARSFNTATAVFTDHYWAGTVKCTGSAINLTPGALVGPTSLLLLEE